MTVRTLLITGAAGDVGRRLAPLLADAYRLRLSDLKEPAGMAPGMEFVAADLSDLAQVEAAVAGVDGIVHLGGYSIEGPWETILSANIVGCYNLFEAAHRHGVERIVFASSNHAVGFYPRSHKIRTDVTLRPDTRYGVSKAFGEAVGALYAFKHGMRVTCLLSIWISPTDLAQLVHIGLDHPDIRFEVFYGASDNERAWWDNSNARRYGYRPSGRGEAHSDAALAADAGRAPDLIADWYQGGPFCSDEYDGDGYLAEK
jgi:uronate dehydrogenase